MEKRFCSQCGTLLGKGDFCSQCGAKNTRVPQNENANRNKTKRFVVSDELYREYEDMDIYSLAEIYFSDDYMPEITMAVKRILTERNVDFSTLKLMFKDESDYGGLWEKYVLMSDDELVEIINHSNNALCRKTASDILKIREDLEQSSWYCPKCGRENDDENNFCPKCGYLKPQK